MKQYLLLITILLLIISPISAEGFVNITYDNTIQPLFVGRPLPITTEQPKPTPQIPQRYDPSPQPVIPPVVPIIPKLPPLGWGGSGGGSFGGAKPSRGARVTDIFRYGQGIGSFGSMTPINFGKSTLKKGKR